MLSLEWDIATRASDKSGSSWDLDHAVPGTLTLAPSPAMLEPPELDYRAMARMIMDAVPFGEVMDAVWVLERQLSE